MRYESKIIQKNPRQQKKCQHMLHASNLTSWRLITHPSKPPAPPTLSYFPRKRSSSRSVSSSSQSFAEKRTGRKNKHNNCSAQGTGVIGSNAMHRNRVNDNCVRVHKKLDLKQSKRPTLFKKKRISALHYKHAFANRKST